MCEIQTVPLNDSIVLFRSKNKTGSFIEVLNYGATLISVVVPDKNKNYRNVVLRYNEISDYFSDKNYLGCTVGPVANRISFATYKLAGKTFYLEKNDGIHCNHGGFSGLHKKIFNYDIQGNEIILYTESQDGEGGFPGNVKVVVSYSFSDQNEIIIKFKVETDSVTPINLTNHTYFNFSFSSNILNHRLKIESEEFLEMSEDFIPTGKILSIKENPAYNFDGKRTIGKMMEEKNEFIKGYNVYFIAKDKSRQMKKVATLEEEESGIEMSVLTTMSGCMLYTGDYLSHPFTPFGALCLEAQYYPDAPNHKDFPDIFLKSGKIWDETIVYSFM
ncbi:MAG TPA: aldose epimerase family protein [Dysgonamonadaceae bacterium]|nr:aldose epimerase family protein [Dysgonamonadaceae bacterium]